MYIEMLVSLRDVECRKYVVNMGTQGTVGAPQHVDNGRQKQRRKYIGRINWVKRSKAETEPNSPKNVNVEVV